MSKITTMVAATIFISASLVLSPAHSTGSTGTAAQRARAMHTARSR